MSSFVPHVRLGSSGLVVSRIALGTMTFGDRTDEFEAQRIFAAADDAGVNFIDTADTYAKGRAEEIIGRLIHADRNRFVLATKLGNQNGPGPNRRGLSRKWIVEATQASLKRLDTDYVDILYLHKEDIDTPLEETVRALADLQRAGAIRYFGVSNFRAWRIALICRACDDAGIDRPVVSQPLYHALNRTAEIEQLPACASLGVGVAVYSPIARGVLTAKYEAGATPPPDSRVGVGNARILESEYHPDSLKAAAIIADRARQRGIEPASFAVAWVLANPLVAAAVAGPRTLDQWAAYQTAVDVTLDVADEITVDMVVAPGTTARPNYIDPAYPVEGRQKRCSSP